MDKVEFTKLIKEVVSEPAIEDTIENLENPPGRKPDEKLLAQSEWYKALKQSDREMVHQVVTDAVHESIFGFLCVLDGVRSISEAGETNDLNLSCSGLQLNDDANELLHDIYKNV